MGPWMAALPLEIYSAEKITVVGTVKRDRSIFLQSTVIIASVVVMQPNASAVLNVTPDIHSVWTVKCCFFHPGVTCNETKLGHGSGRRKWQEVELH